VRLTLTTTYGENEGGKLCGARLAQWGAFALPVGAAIDAVVGLSIERKRRQTLFVARRPTRAVLTTPWVSPSGAGILVSVRF
jgi:hypothetical protein